MLVRRDGNNRLIASFDAAAMLRKVIDNAQNANLVFESVEEHSTNAAMLIDGDVDSVVNSLRESGVPILG